MNKADAAINEGHECVVLSAMMNGSDNLSLTEDDFASPPNRTIYRCLTSLKKRGLLAVQSELERRGQLVAVGGKARLTDISCLPHDPVSVEYALGEVLDASRQRQAAKIGEQMHRREITPEEAQEKLAALPQTKAENESRDSPPPPPYVPPPLDLLPGVLQDYVQAAATSLDVDCSFVFLPFLSSLGAAIGNARSILLKPGFIESPVIWTGIIGESGSGKSPAIAEGCSAVVDRDRELDRQNKENAKRYADEYAAWDGKKKKDRGPKPEQPGIRMAVMSDLTLEVLADALHNNPRGILVRKDELAHWFGSFDQYHSGKDADVSRWLSFHSCYPVEVDRRSDHRHYRLPDPRVGITGGIQPTILKRVLTQDFFDRGLPGRFLFAAPDDRQRKWSEKTVPEHLKKVVSQLFEKLWALKPDNDDDDDQRQPRLLRLDPNAKAVYVAFVNECGRTILEVAENEKPAWHKLSVYAARFALVGQLARDPQAKTVTAEVMRAACDLARWFGNEAARVYATFSETSEQRELRKLVGFIQSRGGSATVRDGMTYHRPLRGNKEKTERLFNALVRAKYGEWIETRGERGPATRKLQLLPLSASAGFGAMLGNSVKLADADTPNSQEIEAPSGTDTEAETLAADESGVVRL